MMRPLTVLSQLIAYAKLILEGLLEIPSWYLPDKDISHTTSLTPLYPLWTEMRGYCAKNG